jgi:hypothetical protein
MGLAGASRAAVPAATLVVTDPSQALAGELTGGTFADTRAGGRSWSLASR